MDAAAIDALIFFARTQGDAKARYRELVHDPDLTDAQVNAALWAALDRHEWTMLLAPELWAAYLEWQSCQRLEHDLDRHRDVLGQAQTAVGHAMSDPFLIGPEGGQVADIVPTRVSAYAKVAAEVTRAEAEYARARNRFVKCAYAVLRRRALAEEWPRDERLRIMLRQQAWLDGEVATVHALMGTPAPSDAGGVTAIMESLARRLPDLSPR